MAIPLQQASPDQQGLLASGVPRTVAALHHALPLDHPHHGTRPPDRVAHQMMIPAHRRAG
ncbi:hypothetical protein [Aeromonas hydrophila]|uniref:hypothetical protein n=1 Tax=Aeromonas hydrophila TaxID=644 RepID=UPI001CC74DAA|nr:hypothetical protein [Aeromonas hydrophila]